MNSEQQPKSLSDKTHLSLDDTDISPGSADKTVVGDTGTESGANEPASNMDSLESLHAGQKIGKYEIRGKLGQGGMGAVFLGFDPMIEREVAIKVLPPEIATEQSVLDRFLSEAKAIGKLANEHVVSIYDIGQHDNLYYIVMELIKGGSLKDFISGDESRDWKESCRIIAEAADGLSAAHAAGLIHRDIKPDNLMLTHEGRVKVVDFGLSKLLDAANDTRDAKTKAGQVLGTPQYMSPEQFQGIEIDERSDIYSLGATYYSLLTGELPYPDCASIMQVMYAHLEQPAPDPSGCVTNLPEKCKEIIERSMAKSPTDRYQNISELSSELKSLFVSSPSASPADNKRTREETYRPLQSAVIAEPSRMQSLILRDALKNSGVGSIQVCRTAAEVAACVDDEEIPELIITSMQLPDQNGIGLISTLRDDCRLDQTMIVLNSNDSTMEDLLDAGHSAPLALVSKKTRPIEMLQAIQACTFLELPQPLQSNTIEASSIKTLIVCDSDRIPDTIANQIRRLGLVDIQIISLGTLALNDYSSDSFDLVLVLRTAGDVEHDTLLYTNLLSPFKSISQLSAAIQMDGERITLRVVQQNEFTAATRCLLDDVRLTQLLQLCRV